MREPERTAQEYREQRDHLAQVMWQMYEHMGFDTSGGMGGPGVDGYSDFAGQMLAAAKEFRRDYDEACEEAWNATRGWSQPHHGCTCYRDCRTRHPDRPPTQTGGVA